MNTPIFARVARLPSPVGEQPRRSRLRVFLPVFLGAALVGLAYTFARPAEYRATASVRVVAPASATAPTQAGASDPAASGHSSGAIAAEVQTLQSAPVLEGALQRLEVDPLASLEPLSLGDLQTLLRARALEGTDVIELSLEGRDRLLLPRVLQAWLDAYLAQRSATQRRSSSSTSGDIDRQLETLTRQIAEARADLEAFRAENDIVSMEQEENQAAAKLKRLNKALADASQKEVEGEARVEAIRRDLAAGKVVLRAADKTLVAGHEARARELRRQLSEAEKRYTEKYLSADPRFVSLREELQDLEARIPRERQDSARASLNEAEQDLASARRAAQTLREQLDAHTRSAQAFTARFAEHQALQKQLQQLEQLYNTTRERRVKFRLDEDRKTSDVQVLAPPAEPERPFRPDYLRDAGISLAGALALGLAAIWLLEFLRRSPREEGQGYPSVQIAVAAPGLAGPAYGTGPGLAGPSGVGPALRGAPGFSALGGPDGAGALPGPPGGVAAGGPAGAAQPSTLAYAGLPREISAAEVDALWSAAGEEGRIVIAALLSGLSPEEVVGLAWEDVDLAEGRVAVRGRSPRVLGIGEPLRGVLAARGLPGPGVGPVLADPNNGSPLGERDLEGLIACAAHDAGMEGAVEITSAVLRHTYVAYLVRQGARLGEIERLVGRLPPAAYADYGRLSPAGPGLPLDQVSLAYPLPA